MENIIASELLPSALQHLFRIGRKNKIAIAFMVFLQLILFTTLTFPQSPAIKQALEKYEKNMYPWKPPEYEQPVDDTILTVLGRWAWGPCHAVDVKGNYAYIGNGPTFHILDISDPTQPEIVGEYLTTGYVYYLKVRDNFVFICLGSGLLILDVTDPSLPQEVSFIGMSGLVIRLAIEDSFVYVITFAGILQVIDISNINNPLFRGAIIVYELPTFVEVKEKYVYVGDGQLSIMYIVNATNPDSLTRTVFYIGGRGTSAALKDSLLFIGVVPYLKIFNISNPTSPEFIGQVEVTYSSMIDGITISEDKLNAYIMCLTSWDNSFSKGIYSIDISDLYQPVISDKLERDTQLGAFSIAAWENVLLAAYYNGVCIVDISKPDTLKFFSFFKTGGFSEKISLKDSSKDGSHYAFIACGLAGVWILDVSDPEAPKEIANINTGGFTSGALVEDSLVYIINKTTYREPDPSRGLWIINISNIYEPEILSHYVGIVSPINAGVSNSITKSGNLILITQARTANSNDILEIVDISDPYKPIRLGVFQGNYRAHKAAIKDNIVFLATSDGGLRIIDISEPTNPIELSNILDRATGVAYGDPYLFTSSSNFSVINVDDPSNPYVVSTIHTHTGSGEVDLIISEDYAYWADWILGVIDISVLNNPVQITTFTGKNRGRGVAVKNEKIFYADQSVGIWILKNNLITNIKEPQVEHPENFHLYHNYPNPFNPETIIEFFVPQRTYVKLEVFNLLGEELKTLIDQEVESGKHKINFNANELASGIYFYRMRTPETSITKKMVILR